MYINPWFFAGFWPTKTCVFHFFTFFLHLFVIGVCGAPRPLSLSSRIESSSRIDFRSFQTILLWSIKKIEKIGWFQKKLWQPNVGPRKKIENFENFEKISKISKFFEIMIFRFSKDFHNFRKIMISKNFEHFQKSHFFRGPTLGRPNFFRFQPILEYFFYRSKRNSMADSFFYPKVFKKQRKKVILHS